MRKLIFFPHCLVGRGGVNKFIKRILTECHCVSEFPKVQAYPDEEQPEESHVSQPLKKIRQVPELSSPANDYCISPMRDHGISFTQDLFDRKPPEKDRFGRLAVSR
jgi:hypothetical protein